MAKMMDLSSGGVRQFLMRSVTKKRTTFWQMVRCMASLKYRPSFLLLMSFAGLIVYLIMPKPFLHDRSVWARLGCDLLALLAFLKILSHETHRFSRTKAKNRRVCCE